MMDIGLTTRAKYGLVITNTNNELILHDLGVEPWILMKVLRYCNFTLNNKIKTVESY